MSGLADKPFDVPKRLVWEAWGRVGANKGAAGVDGVTVEGFEEELQGNLYKIWNRMASGTYVPPAGQGGGDSQAGGHEDFRRAHGR